MKQNDVKGSSKLACCASATCALGQLPVCMSQGLLKVAVESARSQDKHSQQEKKELKLELQRERDARHSLQRQLSSELHSRGEVRGHAGEAGHRSDWRQPVGSNSSPLSPLSLPSVDPEEAEEGEEGEEEAAGGAGLGVKEEGAGGASAAALRPAHR